MIDPAWQESIQDWAIWLTAQGFPRTTVDLRTYHVTRLSRAYPDLCPWLITLDMLVRWFAAHPQWGPDYRRSIRASIRGFYQWATMTGRITEDPTVLLPRIRPRHPVPRPAPEPVISRALLRSSERVELMIRLAASCSMRRGEIARAHTDWIEGTNLRIPGKGGRIRVVPIPAEVAELLARLPQHGYLFPRRDGQPMTPAHVGKLISRTLGPGWSTHTLRHRFSTKAYAAERDIIAVQELMGHAKLDTTRTYTAAPDGAKARAAAGATLPRRQHRTAS